MANLGDNKDVQFIAWAEAWKIKIRIAQRILAATLVIILIIAFLVIIVAGKIDRASRETDHLMPHNTTIQTPDNSTYRDYRGCYYPAIENFAACK